MKSKLLLLLLIFQSILHSQTRITNSPNWQVSNITPNNALNYPSEITYGPDDFLWIAERVGKKIVRVNKATGVISTMIDLTSRVYQASGQDGLLGLAIHPDLYTNIATTTNNYVYAAYTYDNSGRKMRISRFTFTNSTKTLGSEIALLEGLPASNDHNSGRLIIGPDNKLYYTFGDNGANQFSNACSPILSQILPTSTTDYNNYKGKILRLNLDGTIPVDNPTLAGIKSHVYTYGHRNAQGIVFAKNGTLYSSEHGAKVDDELNIITASKNYGWPEIAGYYDNKAYSYCNWSLATNCNSGAFSDHNCAAGVTPANEYTSYPNGAPSDFMPPIGTYNSTANVDPPGGFLSWPTIAPSSIDIYENDKIPNWGKSLLIPSLKKGTLYRAKLAADGQSIVNDSYEEFHSSSDRYRDVAVDPDGVTFYVITDNAGGTSGPSGTSSVSIANPGVIIRIKYIGNTIASPPVAICKNVTLELNAFGQATLLASQVDNGSTDDGTIVNYAIDKSAFDCSHVEIPQTVYLTVTDNQGGESSCSSTVTIVNTTAPLTAPTLADLVGTCSITATPTIINYKCNSITPTALTPTTFSTVGTHVIQWQYTDGISTVIANQNVQINSLDAPLNVTATGIASSSSTLNWNNTTGVTSYDIRFRKVGDISWTSTASTTNSKLLTGLTPGSNYEFQVRSACNSTYSNYSTLATFATLQITYCSAFGIVNTDNHHITRVQLNTLDKTSTGSTYSNFTSSTTELITGTTYNITITKSIPTDNWKTAGFTVWIDYNMDGDFDDIGEKVAGTTNGTNLSAFNLANRTFSFTVPNTGIAGSTRMRVAMMQYWTPQNSCGIVNTDNNSSEVEDYTVNLSVPCGAITTTWNGSVWSNGSPTSTTEAIISGNYSAASNINACKLTVNNNAIVVIPAGYNVTLNGILTVSSGSFTLDNNANLVQSSNEVNIGSIFIKRQTNSLKHLDYTLWSSPVLNQNLLAFSPATLTSRFYTYNTTTNLYNLVSSPSTTNFVKANGYLIRIPNNHPTTATIWEGQFQGVPNNGNFSLTVSQNAYNAIGNPYPSTLNADTFIDTNASTEPLYFWRRTNGDSGSAYATYTKAGGAASKAGGIVPNGIIQIGQGFIYKPTASNTLNFTNTMRIANTTNQFLKTRATNIKSRIWLNLAKNNDPINQMMIAYMDGATTGIDPAIDGRYINDNPTALTSLIQDEEFIIQGRALPFDITDIVPLSFKTETKGDFTIAIDQVDGLFIENQEIILTDTNTGVETNLKNNEYHFFAEAGIDKSRFAIKYQKTLSNSNNELNDNNVNVFKNKNSISIKSEQTPIESVAVYDIKGSLVYSNSKINSNETTIETSKLAHQLLIVKIILTDKKVVTKKVIN